MTKFNAKKCAIIAISVMLAVIVLGAILFGVCKYNYGADVKGAVEITVALDEDSKQSGVAQGYYKDVHKLLEKNGFKFAKSSRIATDESAFKSLIYSVKLNGSAKKTIEKLNGNFKTALIDYFNAKYQDTSYTFDFDSDVQINEIGGNYYCSYVSKTFLAALIFALIVTVYFIIRYNFASGFTSLFSMVLDLAVFLAIIAVVRLKVNGYFVAMIPVTVIYSALLSLIAFAHLKKEFGKKLSRDLIAEKSEKSHSVTNKAILYIGIGFEALLLILVCILPIELKFVALYMMFAVAICTADAILLKPVVRLLLSKIKKQKVSGYAKYAGKPQQEDK